MERWKTPKLIENEIKRSGAQPRSGLGGRSLSDYRNGSWYYFRASQMAPLGLVRPTLRCYFSGSDADPPPEVMAFDGGGYEVCASVLRGSGLCGGPLGIPASAGGGSSFAPSFFGSSVENLGVRPVAPPFRQRAPIRMHNS